MIYRSAVLIVGAMLIGCTAEPVKDERVKASAANSRTSHRDTFPVSSYTISEDDLTGQFSRGGPKDICQKADSTFLGRLMTRVIWALPFETVRAPRVNEFKVRERSDRKGKQAILRFTARRPSGEDVHIVAIGPFSAEGCEIGLMTAVEESKKGASIERFQIGFRPFAP